jgi:hypothetical protein
MSVVRLFQVLIAACFDGTQIAAAGILLISEIDTWT